MHTAEQFEMKWSFQNHIETDYFRSVSVFKEKPRCSIIFKLTNFIQVNSMQDSSTTIEI